MPTNQYSFDLTREKLPYLLCFRRKTAITMGFQPQLSTRTTTGTCPYNNGDDDHSISSTISVNRNNKQPSYKICNTPTYSDGFQLVKYSNTTEITPVIAPPLPPQPPKSHLPSATPRPANAHHQPRKWNQSKLEFL